MSRAIRTLYRLFLRQATALEKSGITIDMQLPMDKTAWLRNGGAHGWATESTRKRTNWSLLQFPCRCLFPIFFRYDCIMRCFFPQNIWKSLWKPFFLGWTLQTNTQAASPPMISGRLFVQNSVSRLLLQVIAPTSWIEHLRVWEYWASSCIWHSAVVQLQRRVSELMFAPPSLG